MSASHALLSVSDKSGLLPFAQALVKQGFKLLSTGGTARFLKENGLVVTDVSEHTGFPEILDGRVKTLHPRVHAGILAERSVEAHLQTLEQHQIPTIDVVVVNLYPFEATVAKSDCTFKEAIENIDIGGPSMIRAAAKNHAHVAIVVDPADYTRIAEELGDASSKGKVSDATRFYLAKKAFAHTAAYDGAISAFLSCRADETPETIATNFPASFHLSVQQVQTLRYGENPHQSAAFYRDTKAPRNTVAYGVQLQGKELSYNNLADADAAWEAVKSFSTSACVIVKHANPCGVALGVTALDAYQKAFATDTTSAFGGIIAFNRRVDQAAAQAIAQQFAEVVIAPAFDDGAKEIFAKKPNVRLLEVALKDDNPSIPAHSLWDMKRIGGGLLVQTPDNVPLDENALKVVSRRQPTPQQLEDLRFVWTVAHYVKSNAIVFAKEAQTLGIGAGQMSRVDSARIASIKAERAGFSLQGAVAASDAFFPFRDGLDILAQAGAQAIIQPGGSIRDDEVIAAADEHDVVMIFTGMRHFRH
ncbi:MAG: bifunctional phosphoribosylaminoimidazolecarboxamide formyltransferase/IMP cyclohydrolase [Pseudomonadota bacterium]